MGVFCYGELGVDNLIRVPHLPSPEVASFPTSETYHVGGAAANTAVWLARWSTPVTLAGNHIGLDPYGENLHLWLEVYPALNLEYVEQSGAVITPFCRVMVTPDGERSFLIFGYPEAPKTRLTKTMLASSDFLALDLYGGDERLDAARVAYEAGIATVVGDVVLADHDILPLTSIATNSAAYIRQVFPGVDIRRHALELQSVSGGVIVTTDGSHPIHVINSDSQEFTVVPPRVVPLDATGAGDAFRAGLMYGLLQSWSLERSVCMGAAAGAFGVQQEGAASKPTRLEEVLVLADSLGAEPMK